MPPFAGFNLFVRPHGYHEASWIVSPSVDPGMTTHSDPTKRQSPSPSILPTDPVLIELKKRRILRRLDQALQPG